jgi:hypothetical protein
MRSIRSASIWIRVSTGCRSSGALLLSGVHPRHTCERENPGRPSGTCSHFHIFPVLKRWAMLAAPPGLSSRFVHREHPNPGFSGTHLRPGPIWPAPAPSAEVLGYARDAPLGLSFALSSAESTQTQVSHGHTCALGRYGAPSAEVLGYARDAPPGLSFEFRAILYPD